MTLFSPKRQDLINEYSLMNAFLRDFRNEKDREVLGREEIINSILAAMARKELTNVALVGDAGVGKTAIVQKVSRIDAERFYFEVDLALMSASGERNVDGRVEMAARLKDMFAEIMRFQKHANREIVVFMDEFHLISETSPAALQALKPLLAESGRHNVRIIVATTSEEYDKYIRGDEALTERLQRIVVPEMSNDLTFSILKSMKKRYVPNELISDQLLLSIIRLTNRYLPSQTQPRKSVVVFDAMIGWHNQFKRPFDEQLLNVVLHDSQGINVDHQMDVNKIKEYLENRVRGQQYAIQAVCNRLYLVRSGLTDPTRPLASLLFSGSTGVGKTELAKSMAYVLYGDDSQMIRFDMSEYALAKSVDTFRVRLATKVWERPSSIILLDEFEKAAPEVTKVLLQVLDDAQLSDRYGREVSFKNSMIVLTTNAAKEVYKKFNQSHAIVSEQAQAEAEKQKRIRMSNQNTDQIDSELKDYQELIYDSLASNDAFPSELLGRIDSVVPFDPLQRPERVAIAKIQLEKFKKKLLQQRGVRIHYDSDVIKLIVDQDVSNDTDAGGGRDIVRQINSKIIVPTAKFVVFNSNYRDIAVDIRGRFKANDVSLLHGDAYAVIVPWKGTRRKTSGSIF